MDQEKLDTIPPPSANSCSPELMRERFRELRQLTRREVELLNELLGVVSRKGLLEIEIAACSAPGG